MNRTLAVVIVYLAAALPCIAQTASPERIDLAPVSKVDWVGAGPRGGKICGVAQDRRNSQILYAGTTSGIFKSTDGGSSWNITSNGLPRNTGLCYHVEIDPRRPAILFAETSFRIYKTIDGGANWEPSDAGLTTDSDLPSIDPTNTDRLYITSPADTRIFKSTNGGNSWAFVGMVPLAGDERLNTNLIVDHTNPAILYHSLCGYVGRRLQKQGFGQKLVIG